MTSFSLLLVVVAAIAHASWNLLAKQAAGVGAAFVFAYGLCASLVCLPWVLWILYNNSMVWSWPISICIALSAVLHLAYNLALQRGYQVADLSVVYPISRGTAPLMSSVAAFFLLNETATVAGVTGMFCVVAGVILIATQGALRLFSQPQAWTGVRWGLLIGAFIALYTIADAYGVKALLIMPVILDWLGCVMRTVMLAPHMIRHRKTAWQAMRGYWGLAWAVGTLAPLGYILVLYALRSGAPVSLVAPAREMSMMLGTLAGYFLLKEKITWGRLVGCMAILAGVVLLGSR